jgi:hypothetical protein
MECWVNRGGGSWLSDWVRVTQREWEQGVRTGGADGLVERVGISSLRVAETAGAINEACTLATEKPQQTPALSPWPYLYHR